ncbi:MAG: hypothetical protein D4R68_02995 [Ignavibacteriales bacterium]|nr:MAG: hypothetical protein D4R68_02995 [Ignavibacteriales bacterium]
MSTIKENLFDLFQLDRMPPEKGVEMLERLSKLVFQAVLVRVLPMLSEEDLAQYEKLVEGKEEGDALFHFLNEKVPGFDKIISEEAETLRMELAGELENSEN